MPRWRAALALTTSAALVSVFVLGNAASATHGPPHTCQGQPITSISLNATNGDDFIQPPGSTADVIATGLGADRVLAGGGNDYVCGNEDSDVELDGGSGNDTVNAGEGSDQVVSGGPGTDTLFGGSGNETTIDGGDGNDTLQGNLGSDTVGGKAGADNIQGNENGDNLYDGYQSDVVDGGASTDGWYRCNDSVGDTFISIELMFGPLDNLC